MRKIFTFLFAALMSVGMFAVTEVTITDSDFPAWGESITKDGVTVSAGRIDGQEGNIMRGGSFSTNLGNFTQIEVNAMDVNISGEGWSGNSQKKTWTGNASSVSFSGEIMGMGMGVTLKFTIEPATVAVTGVTLNQNAAEMTVGGETLTLTATVNPDNATDKSVTWSTSDANVATVENGVVTAVAAGNATITVTTTDGSFTATCAVTVTAPQPAQEESLLTTLTFGGSDTYGETTSGVVTVTATNVGSYNGTYGWLLDEGGSLSVTAKEGYTITKCVFHQNAKTPITDTEAPFEIHANNWGGIIEDPYEDMNGVTSIEVYGYANAGGGSAEPIVVTWNGYDLPSSGTSFTKDGVTLTCDIDDDLYGPGTFTTDLGNFTQIVVSGDEACYIDATGGWSGNINQKTWTGNAAIVPWGGGIYCYSSDVTIVFTIEPASTPEPAGEVTVVFAANNNTVERTVNLPHDFSCSYENKDGELDAIIKELYEISAGHCSDDNYPVASGNEAVLAGSNGFDNYITISAAFEGTATVSGWYWNSDAYDGDGDWMTYTLTISIKDTPTAVENVQTNQVQGTKILRDGMLLIEKNGKIYNVMGAEVK